MKNQPPFAGNPGVLTNEQVLRLHEAKQVYLNVDGEESWKAGLDYSAFDLPLTGNCWRIAEGQRPATRELTRLRLGSEKIEPKGGVFRFDKRQIYLVELSIGFELPPNVCGRATGKSSIGRLDVITRLICADSPEYDVVPLGYSGTAYLLVMPQTFSIQVQVGKSLNQLRLFCGPPASSVIPHSQILDYGVEFWRKRKDRGGGFEEWSTAVGIPSRPGLEDPTLYDMTVDLAGDGNKHIFKARDVDDLIDTNKKDGHDPKTFFRQVPITDESVVLEQNGFYIMKSKERLCIPADVAVEVIAISERIGDLRIHYAGFAHPRFGLGGSGDGTPLIFEVRATDMPTRLYDKSLLAKMQLFRMSEKTEDKKKESVYNSQELQLSSVFRSWS